jgi:hypothetical protein
MTTVPLVKIIYSHPYNSTLERISKYPYPTTKELKIYRDKLTKRWQRSAENTLSLIVEIVGYDWPFECIDAYVAGIKGGFSSPLTVGYTGVDINHAFDILTHELLHNYFRAVPDELLDDYYKQFSSETQLCCNHIVLHAVHQEVYRAQKRYAALKNERRRCQHFPAYRRSWQIVDELGAQNIINMIRP